MTSWAYERARALALEAEREPRPVRGCCGTDVEREACECAENEGAILSAERWGPSPSEVLRRIRAGHYTQMRRGGK
jgi:hypothetical protein